MVGNNAAYVYDGRYAHYTAYLTVKANGVLLYRKKDVYHTRTHFKARRSAIKTPSRGSTYFKKTLG